MLAAGLGLSHLFVEESAAEAYLRPAYRKPWDSMWS